MMEREREQPLVRPDKPRTEDVEKREPSAPRWLKPAEVAGMFGVDRRTVLNWARNGKIKSQRTAGGHRRYRESEVRSLLAELEAVA